MNAVALEIDVLDNGPGVPPELQRRIFEPFFTTKPQGSGTGIGLSFSMGVVEAHGGALSLADTSPEGSCFRLQLPIEPKASMTEPEQALALTDAAPRGAAVVVDDEADLADALARMLRAEGYEVTTAASGREARALLANRDVDLIVSDIRMPEMDGPALFAWLQSERPELAARVAFVTGDTLGVDAVRFLARSGRPVMEKPFTRASVKRLLAEHAEASA
jgi:CheY-like chemotaxis protein